MLSCDALWCSMMMVNMLHSSKLECSKCQIHLRRILECARSDTRYQTIVSPRWYEAYLTSYKFSLNIWSLGWTAVSGKFRIGARHVIQHTKYMIPLQLCHVCRNNSFSVINMWNIQCYFYDLFNVRRACVYIGMLCRITETYFKFQCARPTQNVLNKCIRKCLNRLELYYYLLIYVVWIFGRSRATIEYFVSTTACYSCVLTAFTINTMALS